MKSKVKIVKMLQHVADKSFVSVKASKKLHQYFKGLTLFWGTAFLADSTNLPSILTTIAARRHSFFGHICRCPPTQQHIRPWSLQWIPGPETYHTTTGIASLVDRGLHGWVRMYGTPDSLLPTHGLLPTTGQRGGRYDPQPVTRSSEWVSE